MNALKSTVAGIVMAGAAVGLTMTSAQAVVSNISYSGQILVILDAAGNTSGAFANPGGPAIDDTFSGTFAINPDNAVSEGSPFLGSEEYDFSVVSPTLTFNGSNVNLKPKTGSL